MGNEKQYCERMIASASVTTKNLIPGIISDYGCKSILDVGCADGKFTERIARELPGIQTITAIDPNIAKYRGIGWDSGFSGNITFKAESFDRDFVQTCGKFDCVLFSSVMHEISSYCWDNKKRYSKTPIREAISMAGEILNPGGIVIVRDMIKPTRRKLKMVCVELPLDSINAFNKFILECPWLGLRVSDVEKFFAHSTGKNRIVFHICEDVLMEFLMCFTWGWESFPREVMERKFILDKRDWNKAFASAGFKVKSFMTTSEQYPEYFNKIVKVWEEGWDYPDTTCLIVAEKE